MPSTTPNPAFNVGDRVTYIPEGENAGFWHVDDLEFVIICRHKKNGEWYYRLKGAGIINKSEGSLKKVPERQLKRSDK